MFLTLDFENYIFRILPLIDEACLSPSIVQGLLIETLILRCQGE